MRHHTTSTRRLRALLALGLTTVLTTGVVGVATQSAFAAPGAQRFFVPEEWDGTEHMSTADNPCGPWAATLHEVRHGGYQVLLPPGGQVDGEAHINGAVDGWLEITPDDPSLPTYAGDYREKVDGVLTDPDADQFRVMHFQLRDRLVGTDGSTLVVLIAGKLTVSPDGRAVVDRSVATCG